MSLVDHKDFDASENASFLCVLRGIKTGIKTLHSKLCDLAEHVMEEMFEKLAILSARWPYMVIMLTFIVIAATIPGIFQTRFSRRLEELWLPQGSGSALDAQFVAQNFGDVRPSSLIMTARNEGDDVITRDALLDLLTLHQDVLGLTATVKGTGEVVSYNSTCFRILPLVPCTTLSVLDWWDYDANKIRNDPDLHATLSRPLNRPGKSVPSLSNVTDLFRSLDLTSLDLSHPDTLAVQLVGQLLAQLGGSTDRESAAKLREALVALAGGHVPFGELPGVDPDGSLNVDQLLADPAIRSLLPHALNSSRVLLGNATYDANGRLLRASAISQTYILMAGDERYDEDMAFEGSWLAEVARPWPHMTVYEYTRRSVNDEGQRGVPQALSLFAISFVAMIVYVSLSLGRLHWIYGRVALGVGGVVGIVLSTAIAFGVAGYLDVPFTPLVVGTIFLILGIGVDDMFIIVNEFDRTPRHWTVERRLVMALRHVGSSVTMTSITDLVAFAVSSKNIIPATSGFCVYCSLAVLFNYLVQVTFFVALLVLDTRRMNAGRMDLAPCIVKDQAAADNYLLIQQKSAKQGDHDQGSALEFPSDRLDAGDAGDGDDAPEPTTPTGKSAQRQLFRSSTPIAVRLSEASQKKKKKKKRRVGRESDPDDNDDDDNDDDDNDDDDNDDDDNDEQHVADFKDVTDDDEQLNDVNLTTTLDSAEAGSQRSQRPRKRGETKKRRQKDMRTDWIPVVDIEQYRENKMSYVVAKYLAPALLKPASVIIVFALTAVMLGLGTYGAITMGTTHPGGDAALPDDSYLTSFNVERRQYFPDAFDDVYLVFGALNYADEAKQDDMLAKFEQLKEDPNTRAPFSCWMCDFLDWVQESAAARNQTHSLSPRGRPRSSTQFYVYLYEWLGSSPSRAVTYVSDLTFQYGMLTASRMSAKLNAPRADLVKGDLLTRMRNTLGSDTVRSFPFAWSFLHWEQYVGMISRNLVNFFWVSLSIFLLTCIFIDSLRCALLILLTIVLIDVEMMFVLKVGHMGLTNVSLTLLLLTLGLAIDACAHVVHAYVSCVKKLALTTRCTDPKTIRHYATSIALIETGTSVFSGSVTSFIGVMSLGFASQEILREFCKFFLSMFVYAVFNGLLLLPVLLSLVGPTSNKRWTKSIE